MCWTGLLSTTARSFMAEHTCQWCGRTFHRCPSRSKWGRAKHCSPECQYAARRHHPTRALVTLTCMACGCSFQKYQSQLQRSGGGKYCSRQCRDKHRIGENHPGYIHGDGVNWHGPNWYAQRRRALRRDSNCCQQCGSIEGLNVHHAVPFRVFEGDYKLANKLSNLATLCSSCHRRADAEYQQSE